jgi:hypothetical protein
LSNCVFENNVDSASSTPKGGGIEWAGGGFLNINNCTFNNNTALPEVCKTPSFR